MLSTLGKRLEVPSAQNRETGVKNKVRVKQNEMGRQPS